MVISFEMISFVVLLITFIATIVGWGMKYAADQQTLKSKNEMQDMQITEMKKQMDQDREHNLKQHEEFYENKNVTIELKNDMKHIMASLDDIKAMLGNQRK